ncbi:hypothetical protein SNEBB_003142 [Seison nebaliae]|nr:hypothetical protein SNEBB_003142 [Seison nebaliae]
MNYVDCWGMNGNNIRTYSDPMQTKQLSNVYKHSHEEVFSLPSDWHDEIQSSLIKDEMNLRKVFARKSPGIDPKRNKKFSLLNSSSTSSTTSLSIDYSSSDEVRIGGSTNDCNCKNNKNNVDSLNINSSDNSCQANKKYNDNYWTLNKMKENKILSQSIAYNHQLNRTNMSNIDNQQFSSDNDTFSSMDDDDASSTSKTKFSSTTSSSQSSSYSSNAQCVTNVFNQSLASWYSSSRYSNIEEMPFKIYADQRQNFKHDNRYFSTLPYYQSNEELNESFDESQYSQMSEENPLTRIEHSPVFSSRADPQPQIGTKLIDGVIHGNKCKNEEDSSFSHFNVSSKLEKHFIAPKGVPHAKSREKKSFNYKVSEIW